MSCRRSRAPFNTFCYFHQTIDGETNPIPYAGPFPCRVVPQTQIQPTLGLLAKRLYWVTADVTPLGPVVFTDGSTMSVDYENADRLSFEVAPAGLWVPLLVEGVAPFGEAGYLRTWIGQLAPLL